MEDSAHVDEKLHQNVGQQLKQIGQTGSTVPNTEETPFPLTDELKQVGGQVVGDISHVVGTTASETIGGEVTHIRHNPSKGWFQEKLERVKKMVHFQDQKAA